MNMDPRIHLRSSWRDPVGKLLTNALIAKRQREGWYGPTIQARATKAVSSNGIVYRCACGSRDKVRFLKSTGYICQVCLARSRREAQRSAELAARVQKQLAQVFI